MAGLEQKLMFDELARRLNRGHVAVLLNQLKDYAASYPPRALDLALFELFDGRTIRLEQDDTGNDRWVTDQPLPRIYDQNGNLLQYDTLIKMDDDFSEIKMQRTTEIPWYTTKVDDSLKLATEVVEKEQRWRIEEYCHTEGVGASWIATLLDRDGNHIRTATACLPATAIVLVVLSEAAQEEGA